MNIQKPKPSGTACPNCGVDKAVGCFCASVDETNKQIKCVTCQDTGLVDCETDEGETHAENCLSCDGTGVTGKAEAVAPCVDGCLMCSGEACYKCGAGCWSDVDNCEHTADERHHAPPPVEVGSTGEREGAGEQCRDCYGTGTLLEDVRRQCPVCEGSGTNLKCTSVSRKWGRTCRRASARATVDGTRYRPDRDTQRRAEGHVRAGADRV